MKLFLPSSPTRRYARKHANGGAMPKLLFGKGERRELPQAQLWFPGDALDGDLWGEDDEALVSRADRDGRL